MPTHNKYYLNTSYFNVIDNEEKAYWLGFIWADGYVYKLKQKNRATFYQGLKIRIKDENHLKTFKTHLNYKGKIYNVHRSGYLDNVNHYEISISDKTIYIDLCDLGRNKDNLIIPSIDYGLVPHFIRGFFDGDGSVYCVNKRSVHKGKEYVNSALNCDFICTESMCYSLSMFLDYKRIKYRVRLSKSIGIVYININTKPDIIKFFKYIYKDATVYLPRKYDKFIQHKWISL